jgi:hypothetical protein
LAERNAPDPNLSLSPPLPNPHGAYLRSEMQ